MQTVALQRDAAVGTFECASKGALAIEDLQRNDALSEKVPRLGTV